jgi:long-chain acyl-CoA synthetase
MLRVKDKKNLQSRVTPVHCLLHWEKKQPKKVYMTQPLNDGTTIDYTWKQVANEVKRMAAYLQSLQLPLHSHIGIFGKNSAHWIMADIAIQMAGHVTIPLYPTLSADTAKYVLEHSEAKLLFIGKLDGKSDSWMQVKEVISSDLPCISLPLAPICNAKAWQDIINVTAPLLKPKLPDSDDLATIIYTSGSTGQPKGAMHSFRTMMLVAQNLEDQFKLTSKERLLSYLPLAHGLERVLIETASIYIGCHVFFANNLQTFVADLSRAKPTVFVSVPRLWTKFQHGVNDKIPPKRQKLLFRLPVINQLVRKKILKQLGLDHVRLAITGSAALPVSVISWYRQLGLELLEGYGMTENFAYSHINRIGDSRVGYVGYPQIGVECRISEEGEVQVKSPGTMLGYYKAADKTAETMTADGFLKTGDVGEIDAQGRLKLTGRIKDIFKTAKGKYIAPVPIELKLGESPLIEMVCVGGGVLPQPIGMVMLEEQTQLSLKNSGDRREIQASLESLLKQVNQGLEPHEKLAFLVILSEPWTMENDLLTPTMKIKRQKIEDHYANRFESWEKKASVLVWD